MMKKWVSAVMVGLVVVAWGLAGGITPAWADKEINFGFLNALTGPAAPWGIPQDRCLRIAADRINEEGGIKIKGETYKWKIFSYDHKYVPGEAVKALNKAIFSDKVQFVNVLGGSCLLACMPLLKANNILSMNSAVGGKNTTNPDNPQVFRHNPIIETAYAAVWPYLQKREGGFKTVAVLNPDDETGRDGMHAAQFVAKVAHVTIVAEEFFQRGTKDFSAVLTRVIAKKPDLIDTGYTDPTSQALILKQARELGYKGKIHLAWGPNPKQILEIAGPLAEGVFLGTAVPEPQTELQKDLYKRFLKQYPANEWNPNYYSNYGLLFGLTKAIEKAQSLDPNKVAGALENLTWEGSFGPNTFGGTKLYGIKRQILFPTNLCEIKQGKLIWLMAAPLAKGILD